MILAAAAGGGCRQIAGYGSEDSLQDTRQSDAGDTLLEANPPSDASAWQDTVISDVAAAEAESGFAPDGSRGPEVVSAEGAPQETSSCDLDAGGIDLDPDPGFETASASAGWSCFGGCLFQVTTAAAHCGTHSGEAMHRTAFYQGPAYDLPTDGGGTYDISAWVMQNGPAPLNLLINMKTVCPSAEDAGQDAAPVTMYPFVGGTDFPAGSNTWVFLSGQAIVAGGCTTAQLYLSQNETDFEGGVGPDLFIDGVDISPQ